MQASCKQNINGSFQILRLINFVHVVHQIGGVLYNPPTTKHGGSSSSTLVMTTSVILGEMRYISWGKRWGIVDFSQSQWAPESPGFRAPEVVAFNRPPSWFLTASEI